MKVIIFVLKEFRNLEIKLKPWMSSCYILAWSYPCLILSRPPVEERYIPKVSVTHTHTHLCLAHSKEEREYSTYCLTTESWKSLWRQAPKAFVDPCNIWLLYWFAKDTITKYHALGCLNRNFSHRSRCQNSKPRCHQGWFLPRGVKERSVPGFSAWLVDGPLLPMSSHHLPSLCVISVPKYPLFRRTSVISN